MANIVNVPTARSVGDAAKEYGVGIASGIIYAFLSGLFGSGFLGSIATGVLTGAIVKGPTGTAVTVLSGFNGGISGYSQLMGQLSGPAPSNNSVGVM